MSINKLSQDMGRGRFDKTVISFKNGVV